MSLRLHDTLIGRDPAASCRCEPTASASTRAVRRSTGRPTSATSGRSCSPTCSSGTCAGAACRSRWVMNITDIDDKIIRAPRQRAIDDRRARRALSRALPGRRRGAAHDDARRPAAGDRAHRADGRRSSQTLLDARPRLPDRRRLDLLPDRVVAGLRPAGAPRPRAAAGGGAGRGRRVRQGRRPRLRALEGPEARRAVAGRRRSARADRAGTSSARR